MNKSQRMGLLLGFLSALPMTSVTAHQGATGVVKQRMDLMGSVGESMKTLKGEVKSAAGPDAATVAAAARTIAEKASQALPLFPEGSLDKPTETLPKVWQNWERFSVLMQKLEREAQQMEALANGANRAAIAKQFTVLGKNCRSCHTDFRKKKQR